MVVAFFNIGYNIRVYEPLISYIPLTCAAFVRKASIYGAYTNQVNQTIQHSIKRDSNKILGWITLFHRTDILPVCIKNCPLAIHMASFPLS